MTSVNPDRYVEGPSGGGTGNDVTIINPLPLPVDIVSGGGSISLNWVNDPVAAGELETSNITSIRDLGDSIGSIEISVATVNKEVGDRINVTWYADAAGTLDVASERFITDNVNDYMSIVIPAKARYYVASYVSTGAGVVFSAVVRYSPLVVPPTHLEIDESRDANGNPPQHNFVPVRGIVDISFTSLELPLQSAELSQTYNLTDSFTTSVIDTENYGSLFLSILSDVEISVGLLTLVIQWYTDPALLVPVSRDNLSNGEATRFSLVVPCQARYCVITLTSGDTDPFVLTVSALLRPDLVAAGSSEWVNIDATLVTHIQGQVLIAGVLVPLVVDQGTSPWVVGDGGTPLTVTAGGTPLDVNIVSGGGSGGLTDAELRATPVPMSATDLDIRDLVFATDAVDVSGSVIALDAATLAALETITVNQGTSPWVVSGTVTVNEPVTVDAVDLDIRNLVFATDKVDASGSVVALDAPTLAALETITVNQGTSPWVVSATDLDIRNLLFATDKVDVSGSTVTVNQGTSPWVVGATNLDIRDLVFATDKVDVSGSTVDQGTSPWIVGDGGTPLDVNIVSGGSFTLNSEYAEDSASTSGDDGLFVLAVRRDDTTVAATTNNGDYSPIAVDFGGRVYVTTHLIGEILSSPLSSGGVLSIGLDGDGNVARPLYSGLSDAAIVPGVISDAGFPVMGAVSNEAEAPFTTGDFRVSPIAVDQKGRVAITDLGGSITVDAINLDIRDLVFATDKVDVSGSAVTNTVLTDISSTALHLMGGETIAAGDKMLTIGGLDINTFEYSTIIVDGGVVFVKATDLDIRDLVFATDSVDVTGSDVTVSNFPAVQEVQAVGGTLTDGSGTIATGGTAQNAFASNATRSYLRVQNISPTADLWVNETGAAVINTPGSTRLTPGGSITYDGTFCPTSAISVIGAVTGHPFTAKEA